MFSHGVENLQKSFGTRKSPVVLVEVSQHLSYQLLVIVISELNWRSTDLLTGNVSGNSLELPSHSLTHLVQETRVENLAVEALELAA